MFLTEFDFRVQHLPWQDKQPTRCAVPLPKLKLRYRLRNSLVWVKMGHLQASWKVWVPPTLRTNLYGHYHSHPHAKRPGTREMLWSIRERYLRDGMYKDMQYVAYTPIPRRPARAWTHLAVDVMVPYHRSTHCNQYLLVVTGLFSRWLAIVGVSAQILKAFPFYSSLAYLAVVYHAPCAIGIIGPSQIPIVEPLFRDREELCIAPAGKFHTGSLLHFSNSSSGGYFGSCSLSPRATPLFYGMPPPYCLLAFYWAPRGGISRHWSLLFQSPPSERGREVVGVRSAGWPVTGSLLGLIGVAVPAGCFLCSWVSLAAWWSLLVASFGAGGRAPHIAAYIFVLNFTRHHHKRGMQPLPYSAATWPCMLAVTPACLAAMRLAGLLGWDGFQHRLLGRRTYRLAYYSFARNACLRWQAYNSGAPVSERATQVVAAKMKTFWKNMRQHQKQAHLQETHLVLQSLRTVSLCILKMRVRQYTVLIRLGARSALSLLEGVKAIHLGKVACWDMACSDDTGYTATDIRCPIVTNLQGSELTYSVLVALHAPVGLSAHIGRTFSNSFVEKYAFQNTNNSVQVSDRLSEVHSEQSKRALVVGWLMPPITAKHGIGHMAGKAVQSTMPLICRVTWLALQVAHLPHQCYRCSPEGKYFVYKMSSKPTHVPRKQQELLSHAEALDYFENFDDDELITGLRSADVTHLPPDDAASDDDSGNKNCNNSDILPPKQLSAMAVILTANDNETEESPMQSDADVPVDKSDEEPPARRRRVISRMAQCNFRNLYGLDTRLRLWHEALDIALLKTYQGKNPNGTRPGDQGLGDSPSTSTIFLPTLIFICSLSEKGMKGTGTARINRMGKCPIADKKVIQKCERGSYKMYTEENKGISAVAWRDNNVVYTLSNEHGVQTSSKQGTDTRSAEFSVTMCYESMDRQYCVQAQCDIETEPPSRYEHLPVITSLPLATIAAHVHIAEETKLQNVCPNVTSTVVLSASRTVQPHTLKRQHEVSDTYSDEDDRVFGLSTPSDYGSHCFNYKPRVFIYSDALSLETSHLLVTIVAAAHRFAGSLHLLLKDAQGFRLQTDLLEAHHGFYRPAGSIQKVPHSPSHAEEVTSDISMHPRNEWEGTKIKKTCYLPLCTYFSSY
ncbi:hypothetical protein PR048_028583 [Dryococelus australis]|uniref:Uncharacterized protein n=1 Tax=Dryococelus australis TaxID=614101 RepID=A0ABQ9GDI5_9NEOP|nr:hypothetical protein PR048_028583 [Dryococelus australis]